MGYFSNLAIELYFDDQYDSSYPSEKHQLEEQISELKSYLYLYGSAFSEDLLEELSYGYVDFEKIHSYDVAYMLPEQIYNNYHAGRDLMVALGIAFYKLRKLEEEEKEYTSTLSVNESEMFPGQLSLFDYSWCTPEAIEPINFPKAKQPLAA